MGEPIPRKTDDGVTDDVLTIICSLEYEGATGRSWVNRDEVEENDNNHRNLLETFGYLE